MPCAPTLGVEDREQLTALAKARIAPHSAKMRAQIRVS